MNDNAKKWVAALRSGEFKQAKGALAVDDGFCCLGVACELAVKDRVVFVYRRSAPHLPDEVRSWLGLNVVDGRYDNINEPQYLTNDNDRGKTFAEIADIIESEPEGLFVKA